MKSLGEQVMSEPIQNIWPDEAERVAAENPAGVLWLDVRTEREFVQLGHVPGARLIPHTEISDHIDDIRAHIGPKFVICEHGIRSRIACQILADAGVSELFNVVGGMSQWTGERAFTAE